MKKRVILVTDGDLYAKKAVEHVARKIGGRCISQSWGNPTAISGKALASLIMQTPHDPVLVMFDDCGFRGEGPGEKAMRDVCSHPNIDVIGAIAVASKTKCCEWTKVHFSIDRYGVLTEVGIDKSGLPDLEVGRINGDTVYVLDELNVPVVIGIGDIGKMSGFDAIEKGAPITTRAVQLILERSGYHAKLEGTTKNEY
ncbi:stage V sporulation protein AE [Fictibacillus macauensis ZFHKF-1]|uniref:Stage V sporulation protein AE n=1 Tax=Fictibacillus macauensis ZFHKF-1 TaxID=1196324 RepID=I8UI00_9BACL|nr:stage V sporulation protein AE [Fictibacillus macauensis]EIT86505.1 stage V sporulation protein AE [Fictibacillus macauensis ZFHKF-1]